MANSLEKRKYFFIYKTTNLINGKYYIGAHTTSNLKDGYLGSGKYLRRSIRKYGKESFQCEILQFCENSEQLYSLEQKIVSEETLKDKLCMNLRPGGKGGFSLEEAKKGRAATDLKLKEKYGEDFRSIISKSIWESKTEEEKLVIGLKIKSTYKERGLIRPSFLGKTHSEESKAKQRKAMEGKRCGNESVHYGTTWITKNGVNKKIKKELLEEFYKLGWIKGRVCS